METILPKDYIMTPDGLRVARRVTKNRVATRGKSYSKKDVTLIYPNRDILPSFRLGKDKMTADHYEIILKWLMGELDAEYAPPVPGHQWGCIRLTIQEVKTAPQKAWWQGFWAVSIDVPERIIYWWVENCVMFGQGDQEKEWKRVAERTRRARREKSLKLTLERVEVAPVAFRHPPFLVRVVKNFRRWTVGIQASQKTSQKEWLSIQMPVLEVVFEKNYQDIKFSYVHARNRRTGERDILQFHSYWIRLPMVDPAEYPDYEDFSEKVFPNLKDAIAECAATGQNAPKLIGVTDKKIGFRCEHCGQYDTRLLKHIHAPLFTCKHCGMATDMIGQALA